jgi:hypothetical protein
MPALSWSCRLSEALEGMITNIADGLCARIVAILRRPASNMWLVLFLFVVVFYIVVNVYLIL